MNKLWIKLAVTFFAIYLFAFLLPAVSVSFSYVLLTTLLIVVPGWAGDRLILPHLRNIVASSLDGIYAFTILWIAALLAPFSTVTFTYLILTSLAIAGFEYMLHPRIFNPNNYKPKGARF